MAIETARRIISGRKVITSAGVPVQLLSEETYCYKIHLSADTGSNGIIVFGDSSIVATEGSQQGAVLIGGNPPIEIIIDDVSKVWVDGVVNGDAVTFTYYVP
jgi:hypothetical protein